MIRQLLAILPLLSFSFHVFAKPPEEIKVWNRMVEFSETVELLKRALEVTEKEYGPVKIKLSKDMGQDTTAHTMMARSLEVDLVDFPPTQERLEKLIPIYVPTSRGILGLRICMIRKEDQKFFSSINSLEDLKKNNVEFVLGESWPDKEIMEYNGLKVVSSKKTGDLPAMTLNKKKRCFSRSVGEVKSSMERFKDFGMVPEQHLFIIYNLPSLFFVNPKKPRLAERMKKGLDELIKTREYFKIFWKHQGHIFRTLNIKDRVRIELKSDIENPQLVKMMKDPMKWLPLQKKRWAQPVDPPPKRK